MKNMTSMKLILIFIVLYLLIVSGFFYCYPQWDIKISSFFWDKSHFIYLSQPWVNWANGIRKFLNILIWLVGIFVFIGLIFSFIFKKFKKNKKLKSIFFYLLICIILGPGLLVNWGLKNHWGQPRPVQIQQFSGDLSYQKDWVVSKQCPTNCAFVCGDCAGAFIFMAFVPLLRSRKKIMWTSGIFIILFSGLIGLIRLGQGGHFISDILLAYGIDSLVIWGAYRYLISPSVFLIQSEKK